MHTCSIQQVSIRSSLLFISSWAGWTHLSVTFRLSQQRRRIGSGFNSQWHAFFFTEFFPHLSSFCKVDEEENGGLRGLAEVLLNYGERHFESGSTGARTGLWAAVLLTCGEFERVGGFTYAFYLDLYW